MTNLSRRKALFTAVFSLAPAVFASGCATTGTSHAMRDGPAVAAPAGWVEYCQQNSKDASCRAQVQTVALNMR